MECHLEGGSLNVSFLFVTDKAFDFELDVIMNGLNIDL
jgi:hypothetical protein